MTDPDRLNILFGPPASTAPWATVTVWTWGRVPRPTRWGHRRRRRQRHLRQPVRWPPPRRRGHRPHHHRGQLHRHEQNGDRRRRQRRFRHPCECRRRQHHRRRQRHRLEDRPVARAGQPGFRQRHRGHPPASRDRHPRPGKLRRHRRPRPGQRAGRGPPGEGAPATTRSAGRRPGAVTSSPPTALRPLRTLTTGSRSRVCSAWATARSQSSSPCQQGCLPASTPSSPESWERRPSPGPCGTASSPSWRPSDVRGGAWAYRVVDRKPSATASAGSSRMPCEEGQRL